MTLLRRWPPFTWLLVYVASLFVLMGGQRFDLLVVGVALLVLAFGVAVYLATRPEPGRPRPVGFSYAMAGLAAFYAVSAAAAAPLGREYAVAALLGGLVPSTAVALVFASARRGTRHADGDLEDQSAEDDGPLPVVGFDSATPLGDSPEVHDELAPVDLPRDHPGRGEAERQARRTGTTRGNR
jgi:hypothetical protein